MIRIALLSAALAFATLAGAQADEGKQKAGEKPGHDASREAGLPSIAEEVAEVGPDGTEQDGMSRTMNEMLDAESQDGCDGPMAGREGTGCN
ncbi:MAG: hypothetical protein AAGF49_03115 [Pseudomonadota bacterium]